ncbi:DUF4142 domain-containing protein [Aminobacter sp. MET-1]|uniref:DUF4142 domain-containing protein n=1 Tax=Aminobacter sp. MET-1 TaxID=2951085 RepID=UPI00226AB663|nr:DUF4142 domain-containing protein [Aminobacter sp. MET-1]MCX8570782.1 DUF4142 domain-containing protein [Aminobacter sp. MET-1]
MIPALAGLILSAAPLLAAENAQQFVDKAATGGLFEVETSKLASKSAADTTIRKFADMMIADHGAANKELAQIAGAEKLTLPATLDAQQKATLDKLNTVGAGPAFDASYVEAQRQAHGDAVSLFQGYSKQGENAALKNFATEVLPTLQKHKQEIDRIAAALPARAAVNSGTSGPEAGANSFTETQAQERIQAAGFAKVSALAKDDNGIWRGTAQKDGETLPVALDFRGNVSVGTK